MPDSNRFLNDRPFDRFGLGGGPYYYGWSEDRLRSGDFQSPEGMERIKEALYLPFPVLTDPEHLNVPGLIEYQNSAPSYQNAWYLTDYQPDEAGVLDRELKLVSQEFGSNRDSGLFSLPELSAERDQLEREIKNFGGRINALSAKTRDILLAWAMERLIVEKSSDIPSDDRSPSSTIYGQVKFLWERWGKGFPFNEEFLRGSSSQLFRDSIDEEFVQGQLLGVLRFADQRDQINRKAWYTDQRRMAVEYVIQQARKTQSIAAERTSDTSQSRERNSIDGRVKGLDFAPDMVRLYWEIMERDPNIRPPAARGRVLEEFDNVVTDRTLQRYLKKHDRPDF